MKQPLMLLPPAQAEALYDASLQQPAPAVRAQSPGFALRDETWDDDPPTAPIKKSANFPVHPEPSPRRA